jgi:limonene-1,2-epoxide hydrolase
MSSSTNEAIIRDFCTAIERRDIDELLWYFADDAVYHNIPFPPAQGHDAIRATFETYVPGSPAIEFEMVNLAVAGDVVFTERLDRMTFAGKDVELPVAGVFELRDGKITAWRDYFDQKMFFGA